MMKVVAEIRERLTACLAELETQLERLEAQQREPLGGDLPDQVIERAGNEALSAGERAILHEIMLTSQAITRLDDGLYGLCTECGVPIDAARLDAVPAASRCIACERERGL